MVLHCAVNHLALSTDSSPQLVGSQLFAFTNELVEFGISHDMICQLLRCESWHHLLLHKLTWGRVCGCGQQLFFCQLARGVTRSCSCDTKSNFKVSGTRKTKLLWTIVTILIFFFRSCRPSPRVLFVGHTSV